MWTQKFGYLEFSINYEFGVLNSMTEVIALFLKGGPGQRSQSNSMQQKTQGSKSNYGSSPYWANWNDPRPERLCAHECVKLKRKGPISYSGQHWAPHPVPPSSTSTSPH